MGKLISFIMPFFRKKSKCSGVKEVAKRGGKSLFGGFSFHGVLFRARKDGRDEMPNVARHGVLAVIRRARFDGFLILFHGLIPFCFPVFVFCCVRTLPGEHGEIEELGGYGSPPKS